MSECPHGIDRFNDDCERCAAGEAMDSERAACLEIIRAAGCLCFHLVVFVEAGEDFDGEISEFAEMESGKMVDRREVIVHDHRCPQALAAQIEARGEGETS